MKKFKIQCSGGHTAEIVTNQQFQKGDILHRARMNQLIQATQGTFILQRHWFRGPIVIRRGPSKVHWDLWLFYGGKEYHYVLEHDPLTTDKIAAGYFPQLEKKCYEKGKEKPEELKPSTVCNPTKDTPSWIQIEDQGKLTIFEDNDLFKKFEFHGKDLREVWVLRREDPSINIWTFEKSELPKPEKMNTKQFSLIDDNKIRGPAMSPGVWGGLYLPLEVIESAENFVPGLIVDKEHNHNFKVGVVIETLMEGEDGIAVSEINHEPTLEEIRSGHLTGYSMDVWFIADRIRRVLKWVSFNRLTVTMMPACLVCRLE